jgi:hypothetical protein
MIKICEEDDEFDIFDIYEDSPELEIPYDLIAELQGTIAKPMKSAKSKSKGKAAVKKNAASVNVAASPTYEEWRDSKLKLEVLAEIDRSIRNTFLFFSAACAQFSSRPRSQSTSC